MKINHVIMATLSFGWMAVAVQAETAVALIAPATAGMLVEGSVSLQDTPEGLKISVDIQKGPTGKHALHIHEFGSCSDDGKAAGSHYNPESRPHGNTMKDGVIKVHPGDFGSLTIGADGKGVLQTTIKGLTLSGGKYPVAGRAFILHEKEDDFSQPTGNAGGRIGCGPIVITGK